MIFIIYLMMEVIARFEIHLMRGAPFFAPGDIIYSYYPMIRDIKKQYARTDTGSYKILVLSSSTLHREWGQFDSMLTSQLILQDTFKNAGYKTASVVFNASGVGYSSRDNLNCYALLTKQKFDLIIYYSAINDARFSNCPANVFKEDYRHNAWNNEIRCILQHPEINILTVPFFADYLFQLFYENYFRERFIPIHYSLRQNWWDFGSDLKSVRSLKNNIKAIGDLSKKKNEKFLLVSFCHYIPNDYTLSKFKNKTLDYSFQPKSRETEIWGHPANINSFIDSSNVIIRQTAGSEKYDLLQMHLAFKNPDYFADVCHFSPEGMNVYCQLLAQKIVQMKNQ